MKHFSTIVSDLVGRSNDLARQVSQILKSDCSIASAVQSYQFDQHILKPAWRHHIGMPVVIMINALDEGCDRETLEILRNLVPKLLVNVHILVTSQTTDDIHTDLPNASHVQC